METILQDIKYSFRMLISKPSITFIAALSLAFGIGANTTVFSWVKSLLLRPLPGIADPDRIVVPAGISASGSLNSASYPEYVDFQKNNNVFDGITAFSMQSMSLTNGDRSDRVYGGIVSGNFFDVFGVKAASGRTFLPEEDMTPGTHPVAVISHSLWKRRFNSDPNLVGNAIVLNGHKFTVIGIAPEKFKGSVVGLSLDIWTPLMMQEKIVAGSNRLVQRGNRWLQLMARLKPGVSAEQAQAMMNTIAAQLGKDYPEGEGRTIRVYPLWLSPWGASQVMRPVLFVLTAVVGLVLLIACANVANLLLSRAVNRKKEIAIRLSLGASRFRLIRQLLTESVILALIGGSLGMLFTFWTSDLLTAFIPRMDVPVDLSIELDGRVFAFTLAVSIFTGMLFGLAPALQASNPNLVAALKDGTSNAEGRPSRFQLRNLLVVAQVSLSLMLLIAAGLFLKALEQAQKIDIGFDPRNVLISSMDLFTNGYDKDRGINFYKQLLERAGALPGVQSVSVVRRAPLGLTGSSSTSVAIDGYVPRKDEEIVIDYNNVGPDYFRTMSIPIVKGREFNLRDEGDSRLAAVINETMARRYWKGEDPIGKSIRIGKDSIEVIGVAKDGKYRSIGEEPIPFLFLSILQSYRSDAVIVARTAGPPEEFAGALRETVKGIDPNLPLYDSKTMFEHMEGATLPQRIAASMLGIFGTLALLLASVGLYGVVSYSVSQRTREIGIRMAIGAQRSDIIKTVVGNGFALVLTGIVIGLFASFGLTRFLSSLLNGVSATDAAIFSLTPILLGLVAFVACYVPARRASKVDPMIALRYE